MSERELAIVVVARGIQKATGQILTLDRKLQHLGKATRNASANLQRGVAIAATAAAGGILYATKQAGDFEAQLLTINTIARESTDGLGRTQDGLDAIGDGLRRVARDTGTPLEDLTQGYYDLLSAGIKTADAQNVLTASNRLAIGGLSTTAEAIDLLTTAINSYGGDASKAAVYGDMFAEAIAAGKTTASEIAASFAQVAPLAAKSGIGVDELAAALGVMTASGTPAAEAMTQARSAIKLLLKPTSDLAKLQKEQGVNYAKMARDKGLAYTYNEIEKAAKKAGIPMAALTGRIEATLFSSQVAGTEYAKYAAELDKVRHSSGLSAAQAAERQQSLNFELAKLKANIRDAAITVGTELIPVFADLAQEATGWLQGHQPEVKQFAKDLGAGIREAVTWLKGLDWNAITNSLMAAAGFAKTMVSAFLSLPAPIQQFLAVGFAANKFTGGVIGDIFGDLAKGLIKGVLGINAGVVNVNGGVVNGGVGGLAGAAGGKGKIALLGSFILPVAAGLVIGEALHSIFGDGPLRDRATGPVHTDPNGNPVPVNRVQNVGPPRRAPMSPDERQAFNDQRTATIQARDKIESARIATVSKLGSVQAVTAMKGDAIVAAIRGIKLENHVNVNTYLEKGDSRSRTNYQSGTKAIGPSGVSGPGHGA